MIPMAMMISAQPTQSWTRYDLVLVMEIPETMIVGVMTTHSARRLTPARRGEASLQAW